MPKPSQSKITMPSSEATGSGANVESVEPKRRRTFSAAYKRRIVKETASCTESGSVVALLRREGLYSSHLTTWRRQFETGGTAALAARKPGRKRKKDAKERRIEQLEKDKARLEHELHVARKLLELQKKPSELLGISLSPSMEGDKS